MRIEVSGTVRDVANSAWISTIDDVNANKRSDEEVDRVTTFLAKNFHTSPFECISLTFFWNGPVPSEIKGIVASPYSREFVSYEQPWTIFRDPESHITIDLWNFIKEGNKIGLSSFYKTDMWKLFKEKSPSLANKVELFDLAAQKFDKTMDVNSTLGNTNMKVELISLHDTGSKNTSRATWRVKCPLSIATQILRHRTGSFNQVSGRYRTVKNDFISELDDVSNIFKKIIDDNYYSEYMDSVKSNIAEYEKLMSIAKCAKNDEKISNNEYKRLREVARYILPEGRMTELYVTFYLNDFDHYLLLRNSPHAQIEHIWIAQMMKAELNKKLDNNK